MEIQTSNSTRYFVHAVLGLFQSGQELHDRVGETAGNERANGDALEEEYAGHRANDEGGDHLRRGL